MTNFGHCFNKWVLNILVVFVMCLPLKTKNSIKSFGHPPSPQLNLVFVFIFWVLNVKGPDVLLLLMSSIFLVAFSWSFKKYLSFSFFILFSVGEGREEEEGREREEGEEGRRGRGREEREKGEGGTGGRRERCIFHFLRCCLNSNQ